MKSKAVETQHLSQKLVEINSNIIAARLQRKSDSSTKQNSGRKRNHKSSKNMNRYKRREVLNTNTFHSLQMGFWRTVQEPAKNRRKWRNEREREREEIVCLGCDSYQKYKPWTWRERKKAALATFSESWVRVFFFYTKKVRNTETHLRLQPTKFHHVFDEMSATWLAACELRAMKVEFDVGAGPITVKMLSFAGLDLDYPVSYVVVLNICGQYFLCSFDKNLQPNLACFGLAACTRMILDMRFLLRIGSHLESQLAAFTKWVWWDHWLVWNPQRNQMSALHTCSLLQVYLE